MNSTNPMPVEPLETPPPERYKINWLVFFAVLLAPPVVTLLAAMIDFEGLAVGTPFVGGAIAGIACGIMLAFRVGRTRAVRVLLSFVFTAVFAVLSFALSFAGCMTGGFNMGQY